MSEKWCRIAVAFFVATFGATFLAAGTYLCEDEGSRRLASILWISGFVVLLTSCRRILTCNGILSKSYNDESPK